MKWSFASIGVIIAGITGVAMIFLFQQVTTKNEEDYYLLREITYASMKDALDTNYNLLSQEYKMSKEKFVEVFMRRFAGTSRFDTQEYKIEFYDIIESPPKVSIRVLSNTGQVAVGNDVGNYKIVNQIDVILETMYKPKEKDFESDNRPADTDNSDKDRLVDDPELED